MDKIKQVRKNMINNRSKFIKNITNISILLLITFAVLLTSHFINYTRIKAHEAYLHEIDTRSLIVYFDGIEVGEVRNKDAVDNILYYVKRDLEEKYEIGINFHNEITYKESHAEDENLTTASKLYDAIKSKVSFGIVGYGIEVNGEILGILDSEQEANEILDAIKKPYIDKMEEEAADVIDLSYAENVRIVELDTDFSKLDDPDTLLKVLQRGTDEEKIHIVEMGDSFWSISREYNLTVDDLIAANPSVNPALIHPGDELSLIIPKPYIGVETKSKVVLEEKIEYETEYQYVSYLYNDEYRVKKSGEYGIAEVEAIITRQNGLEVEREVLSETVVLEPVTKIILQGTKEPPPKKGTGYFINPLPSGYISSRFGPRWGGYHYGLDLSESQGTAIKAADGGVVIFAGWRGGYGNLVEVDHGGGFTTRYAHCSVIYVTVGEKVYQGKTLALVGNTGISTGPHVHFEVRKYGTPENPQNYIGIQYR